MKLNSLDRDTLITSALQQSVNAAKNGKLIESSLMRGVAVQIASSRRKLKPYVSKKYCNYPNAPKLDDFSLARGLGDISLQGAIDKIDSFKNSAIQAIKTKIQAMGPPASKDAALASGVTALIKEVYDAAKCFTSTIQKINELISTYINAVNIMIVQVVATINRLTTQIEDIKREILNTQQELLDATIAASLTRLNEVTGVFDLLAAVNELNNALIEAKEAADDFFKTPDRIMLHLEAQVSVLQSALLNLRYALELQNTLNANLRSPALQPLQDDFLSDFAFRFMEAGSYNFTLTNSNAISDCNLYDDRSVIPQLNKLAKNFDQDNPEVYILDARQEKGYIVVPDGSEGLISCGISPDAGYGVALVFELHLNSGSTIIRAFARGEKIGDGDIVCKKAMGVYVSKSHEQITYNKLIELTPTTWELVLENPEELVRYNKGDRYSFTDHTTREPWSFKIRSKDLTKNANKVYPLNWKVIDINHTSVIVEFVEPLLNDYIPTDMLDFYHDIDLAQDLIPHPGYTSGGTWSENITTTAPPPTPYKYKYTAHDNTVDDVFFPLVTLKRTAPFSTLDKMPHAGEKIYVENWTLLIRLLGDDSGQVQSLRFQREKEYDNLVQFFLKASWGFIPDEI